MSLHGCEDERLIPLDGYGSGPPPGPPPQNRYGDAPSPAPAADDALERARNIQQVRSDFLCRLTLHRV